MLEVREAESVAERAWHISAGGLGVVGVWGVGGLKGGNGSGFD